MRFSFWPASSNEWSETLSSCLYAEGVGFDGLWYSDHFMPFQGSIDGPIHECWTTLAGLAAAVPRVRIGSIVTGATYRHPAVLAKQAATVDHISGGRCVLGIGAGWQRNEHVAYGIEYPSVKDRLDRLEEACTIVTSLLRNDRTTFSGAHFHLEDAPLSPKPVNPHLPLLVGGGGEQRTLRIAARHADEWNIWGDPALLARKGAILERHCEAIRRDPAEISRSAIAMLLLSDDQAFLTRMRARDHGRATIIGTPAEVVEIVHAYADAGVDELIIPDVTLPDPARKRETLAWFMSDVASTNFVWVRTKESSALTQVREVRVPCRSHVTRRGTMHVDQIWIYTVKSMLGGRMPRAQLSSVGIVGDRLWALRDEQRGAIASARRVAGISRLAATYDAAGVRVHLPDGSQVASGDADANDRLSEAVGHPVSLWGRPPASEQVFWAQGRPDSDDMMTELRAVFGRKGDEPLPDLSIFPPALFEYEYAPGTLYDCFPLMLMTTSALRSLQAALPDSAGDRSSPARAAL